MAEKSDRPEWAVAPKGDDRGREKLIRFRKLEEEAIDLKKSVDANYMALAEKLRDIQKEFAPYFGDEDKAIQVLGYRNFVEWAERRLGYERGKAFMLAQVWAVLVEQYHVPRADMKAMSLSNAHELVRANKAGKLDKTEERKKLIGVAKTSSVRELREVVQDSPTEVPVEEGTLIDFRCKVTPAQKANIERALETAFLMTKSEPVGNRLDLIATEFNASYPPTKKTEAAMHALACRFEEAFGVKLIIYHADKGVIRGQKLVEEASKS